MVVVSSRQMGLRPETIRTRLARFMPTRATTGWSVGWSTETERAEEIGNEDELRAAEHLGCYGSAVAHALGQAEISPLRLHVTAEATPPDRDGTPQPITVEIRAHIPGPMLDPGIIEAIARRTEPNCPVWRSLASEVGIKLVAILEDPTPTTTEHRQPSAQAAAAPSATKKSMTVNPPRMNLGVSLPKIMPKWLTPRTAGLIAVALGALAIAPKPFLS